VLGACLRHQHSIDRIAVAPGKAEQCFAMIRPNRAQVEPVWDIEQALAGGARPSAISIAISRNVTALTYRDRASSSARKSLRLG
jgi:hypothetical protein